MISGFLSAQFQIVMSADDQDRLPPAREISALLVLSGIPVLHLKEIKSGVQFQVEASSYQCAQDIAERTRLFLGKYTADRADQPLTTRRYVMQSGEDFVGIALRQLKDENRWYEISQLNNPERHHLPVPGSVIRLPRS